MVRIIDPNLYQPFVLVTSLWLCTLNGRDIETREILLIRFMFYSIFYNLTSNSYALNYCIVLYCMKSYWLHAIGWYFTRVLWSGLRKPIQSILSGTVCPLNEYIPFRTIRIFRTRQYPSPSRIFIQTVQYSEP